MALGAVLMGHFWTESLVKLGQNPRL